MARNVPARVLTLTDAAAILLFVSIGLVSHHKALNAAGYARDALPLLGGWFGAALVLRPYADRRLRRIAATWLAGVTLGVLVRALVLERSLNGKEAAFLGVALVTIGVFVLVLRAVASLMRPSRPASPAAP